MKNFYFLLVSLGLWATEVSFAQSSVLFFVPNQGQWEEDFLYKSAAPFADIYLEASGVTYVVGAEANAAKMATVKETAATEPVTLSYHAYKMKWLGANENAPTEAAKKEPHYLNFYLGNDPKRWQSGVGVYRNVDYHNLYPGIDVHFSSDEGHAKYDFIVKPGGDPRDIRLQFEGLDGIKLEAGNLILATSVGTIRELKPFAYQYVDGTRIEVACRYSLKGNILTYVFPDGYDRTKILTIDPTIVFATLTGSTADNWGFTATYDAGGNLYAGGIANGLGYPTSLGAFQTTFGGGSATSMPCDITISKFDASGSSLLYSTYLGGSEDDMPHSLVVDDNGNLILAGKSMSANFPTTTNAYQPNLSGSYDLVLVKFNAGGTGLLGATYLGGSGDDGVNINASFAGNQDSLKYNYGDASRTEVIIDRNSNIYLAASSRSANFPTTANAAKTTLGGSQDGIFSKFDNNLSTLIYSTYIGGTATDAAYVITLDTAETHVYVGGGTVSSDFQQGSNNSSVWQSSYQGGIADGFICRYLNSGAYTLLQSSYIGTSAYDQVYGLQTDLENGVYAMGQTLGAFPVSPGVYHNANGPQFLIKLDSLLTVPVYSTVFGVPAAKPNISPVAFLVDTCQNVYISGWGAGSISPGSTTSGLPITTDAFQSTTDGNDFYFIVFSKDALSLLFGSYFGAAGKAEHVDGGTSRFDPNGVVYQAICASCGFGSAFPATTGAYATTKGSLNCNLGAVKIAFNLGSVIAAAHPHPDSTGCAPLTIQFINNSANATNYYWEFGDGTSSNTTSPTHTFQNAGTYQVMLVASNPNACTTEDTLYLSIVVRDDTIQADFDFQLTDTCTNPTVHINNLSTNIGGQPLSTATFFWDFGDGTTTTGENPPPHPYASPGTYEITLVMTHEDACNSPDTIKKSFSFSQIDVTAGFTLPDTICLGAEINLTNTSQNATQYQWQFGDGASSTDPAPTHAYTSPGTYTIQLIAANPASCNKSDSTEKTITVFESPKAAFTVTPFQGELNVPSTFHNNSQNAIRYHWDFGDGSSSSEENPVHQYNQTGSYEACLTAYNSVGCADRACRTVYADVSALADLPTAFSPNGDGNNDILYVRGYSIKTMHLKIFNRWGELIFESKNQNLGWDGTYKGKPQEMDAYAYLLEVTFMDGSALTKQGNVTLLR